MKRSREDDGEVEAQAMTNCLMLLSSIDRDRRNLFECKTCKKQFSSFQALGGHRTSHKSLKSSSTDAGKFLHGKLSKKRKIHECSICGMEFPMGQALGGHMRRHRAPKNEIEDSSMRRIPILKKSNSSKRILCVDLNLTPDENDDFQLFPMAPAPVLRCFF